MGEIFISNLSTGIISSLLASGLTCLIHNLIINFGYYKDFFKSLVFYNKDIRFSMAYLFRIKLNGKYLLIKGARIDQYQPVGGVFKFQKSFQEIARQLEVKDDDNIPIDEISKDDLRVKVKGKKVIKLIKWFYSRLNREVGVHREFIEELIKPGYLNIEFLSKFNPQYIKTFCTNINKSTYHQCREILIYEIYEVLFDEETVAEFTKTVEKSNGQLILVSDTDIEKETIYLDSYKKIGKHSKYIL
ncbi:MAG: hypothetical protein MI740_11150 [Halanaerobiales bacterium]|nr:hypothetical protein [Halanaerobiales bacterium]